MTSNYSIDSHKMHLHPERLAAWLNGETVAPIYLEISPSSSCNCRCRFCGMDFLGYKRKLWDTDLLKDKCTQMGKYGLKSIMFAGEGEPFTHPHLPEVIQHANNSGVDIAITTNAILMDSTVSEAILDHVCWIKASVNAGSEDTYALVHGVDKKLFTTTIANLEKAATIRAQHNYKCTLGMQMVLLPDNANEAVNLAHIAKNAGMDYLVIKPYSQHPLSANTDYKGLKYQDLYHLEQELRELKTDSFNIIFRSEAMKRLEISSRPFQHCLGLPFAGYIDTEGNLWGCLAYISDDRFYFGNINEEGVEEVFFGPRRKKALKWAANDLEVSECRQNCRMEAANAYLWQLKNPSHHSNFI